MNKSRLSNSDAYIAAIKDAADGEVHGEVMFRSLQTLTHPDHRDKLKMLTDVEIRTGAEMRGLVKKYDIVLNAETAAKGEVDALKYEGMDWRDILSEWSAWIPRYVQLYDELADSARPEDRDALEFLAAHERAISDFINLELSGDSEAAMSKLRALLSRPVAHVDGMAE